MSTGGARCIRRGAALLPDSGYRGAKGPDVLVLDAGMEPGAGAGIAVGNLPPSSVEPGAPAGLRHAFRPGNPALLPRPVWTGWAVGMLRRPAAVPVYAADLGSLRDTEILLEAPELLSAVSAAMSDVPAPEKRGGPNGPVANAADDGGASGRRTAAVVAAVCWLEDDVPAPGVDALLANLLEDAIHADTSLLRVAQATELLGVLHPDGAAAGTAVCGGASAE